MVRLNLGEHLISLLHRHSIYEIITIVSSRHCRVHCIHRPIVKSYRIRVVATMEVLGCHPCDVTLYFWTSAQKRTSLSRKSPCKAAKRSKSRQDLGLRSTRRRAISSEELIKAPGLDCHTGDGIIVLMVNSVGGRFGILCQWLSCEVVCELLFLILCRVEL